MRPSCFVLVSAERQFVGFENVEKLRFILFTIIGANEKLMLKKSRLEDV